MVVRDQRFSCPQQERISSPLCLCAELLICINCTFVLNQNEVPPLGTGIYPFIVCCLVSVYWIFLIWSVALC
jgi:hypothetical protein